MYRIAIDGPGGAGKSTIAKAVAKQLGIDYIDTGAMYRAMGLASKQAGIDMHNADELQQLLDNTEIDFSGGKIYLNGADVSGDIRTPEISALASAISAIPAVREKLVALQRAMGQKKSVIMDGRDIGTNVLKDAEIKVFMTATIEERAKRRYDELKLKGQDVDYDQIFKDIQQRDYNDSTRKINPLKKADDAVELDTTSMSIEEVIASIIDMVGDK